MVDLIIFSKNRAMQLHALLESISVNLPDFFDISVLYTYTDKNFKYGYEKLIKIFGNFNTHFYLEDNFRNNVKSLVSSSTKKNISFSTDDNIIYRSSKLDNENIFYFLPKHESECFSLRLGLNTIVQNHITGQLQPPLNRYFDIKDFISWNNTLYNPIDNYGYPFSVDFHVYRTSLIQELVQDLEFNNVNSLESSLFNHRGRICHMISFKESVCVNIPMNNQSGMTSTNKKSFFSTEELNKKYLEGYTFDIGKIEEKIVGCHQDIELKMRRR